MAKKLWSLSAIASETSKNFRTVAKSLANIRPDGKAGGKPASHMSTAIAALEEHTRRTGYIRSKPAPERWDPELETKIAAIEESGAEVDALLVALRAEPSVARRREIDAKCVGRHMRALEATIGDNSSAFLRKAFVDQQMGYITGEILSLLEWKLEPEAP